MPFCSVKTNICFVNDEQKSPKTPSFRAFPSPSNHAAYPISFKTSETINPKRKKLPPTTNDKSRNGSYQSTRVRLHQNASTPHFPGPLSSPPAADLIHFIIGNHRGDLQKSLKNIGHLLGGHQSRGDLARRACMVLIKRGAAHAVGDGEYPAGRQKIRQPCDQMRAVRKMRERVVYNNGAKVRSHLRALCVAA